MTLSPEERAKGVISLLRFDNSWLDWHDDEISALIASAIKEAEDAALERAARAVEAGVESHDPYEYGLAVNSAARQAVDIIEALQHKD